MTAKHVEEAVQNATLYYDDGAFSARVSAAYRQEFLTRVPGQNNKLHRHSQLKDINTGNVAKLQHAWSQSTGALRGHEGQPVVVEHNGKPMMYFSSGCPEMSKCNIVQALDLSDPDNPVQIWNYVKKTDRDESAVPRACCDTVHRGVNYVANKIVYHTLDGFVIALDAATGQEVRSYPDAGSPLDALQMIAPPVLPAPTPSLDAEGETWGVPLDLFEMEDPLAKRSSGITEPLLIDLLLAEG